MYVSYTQVVHGGSGDHREVAGGVGMSEKGSGIGAVAWLFSQAKVGCNQ